MAVLYDYLREAWPHIYTFVYWGYILIVIITSILVISDDKNPSKTLAWILVLVFIPVFGVVLYVFFGQDYRKRKIFSRKGLQDFLKMENLSYEQLNNLSSPALLKNKAVWKKLHIIRLLLNNSKAILSTYNRVTILKDGHEKFHALKKALESATHHIHLEYYIFEDDSIGKEIINTLISKAKEGIKIRFIYDHVGSWHLGRKSIKKMKTAGIDVAVFMKVTFPFLTSKINYRNHRKIAIIDGRTAFVGGMNIANHYMYGTKRLGTWRDTHLLIEGNAVQSLQSVFITDWFFVTNTIPPNTGLFPKNNIKEQCLIQIASSGPDSDWASIMQTYFYAISTARKKIHIATPYFLPNNAILTALKTASLSGVDVKLVIPKKSDSKVVHFASISYVKELLNAGIKVFLYSEGFIHSKVLIVDDVLSSVGTANMDYRSFSLNFEVNAIIYNEKTALELESQFMEDIKKSEQLTLSKWNNRPRIEKLQNSIARVFSPLL